MFVIVDGAMVGLLMGGIWRWYVFGEGAIAAGLAKESHSVHGCGKYGKTRNHHCIKRSDNMNTVSPRNSSSDIAAWLLPALGLLMYLFTLPPSSLLVTKLYDNTQRSFRDEMIDYIFNMLARELMHTVDFRYYILSVKATCTS